MMDLGFWIPVLGVPLAALFSNVVVRKLRGLPQSALPDIMLCFVVFDALVAIQNEDFKKLIHLDFVKDAVDWCLRSFPHNESRAVVYCSYRT
jgi:hypothetical protein